ncbi:MAG: prephenate dehydratase [Lachnospiraceae bacterium]|nr:prephenate dehydratase [Lachnospiraceae bacterium]
MELSEIREKLDIVDKEILRLFEERMELSGEVAEWKLHNNSKVFDKKREEEKLAVLSGLTDNAFNKMCVAELFKHIMSMSRKLQYKKLSESGSEGRLPFIAVDKLFDGTERVVYQGAPGSYSQLAMQRFFGKDIKNFHVDTFREAMSAIDDGSADFAVLPIENSTAGIVTETYDLLVEFENYIVAEQIIPIEHCLLGVEGASLDTIKTVYSHPQSLMQSARFLESAGYRQISMQNNAFAAKKVADEKDISIGAIAGEQAAAEYGLNIIKRKVNQEDENSTRFIIATNQKIFKRDAGKVSICFEIPHEAGSLYQLLSNFIYNDLNMTKIESRPIENRNWEYRFFVDFEGNLSDGATKNALRGLRDEARNMKILGNY